MKYKKMYIAYMEFDGCIEKYNKKVQGTPISADKKTWYMETLQGNLVKINSETIEPIITRHEPKRKPDENGMLPLTESELDEFNKAFKINADKIYINTKNIYYIKKESELTVKDRFWGGHKVGITHYTKTTRKRVPLHYKAIRWLAERFNLEMEVK